MNGTQSRVFGWNLAVAIFCFCYWFVGLHYIHKYGVFSASSFGWSETHRSGIYQAGWVAMSNWCEILVLIKPKQWQRLEKVHMFSRPRKSLEHRGSVGSRRQICLSEGDLLRLFITVTVVVRSGGAADDGALIPYRQQTRERTLWRFGTMNDVWCSPIATKRMENKRTAMNGKRKKSNNTTRQEGDFKTDQRIMMWQSTEPNFVFRDRDRTLPSLHIQPSHWMPSHDGEIKNKWAKRDGQQGVEKEKRTLTSNIFEKLASPSSWTRCRNHPKTCYLMVFSSGWGALSKTKSIFCCNKST